MQYHQYIHLIEKHQLFPEIFTIFLAFISNYLYTMDSNSDNV